MGIRQICLNVAPIQHQIAARTTECCANCDPTIYALLVSAHMRDGLDARWGFSGPMVNRTAVQTSFVNGGKVKRSEEVTCFLKASELSILSCWPASRNKPLDAVLAVSLIKCRRCYLNSLTRYHQAPTGWLVSLCQQCPQSGKACNIK